MLKTKIKSIIDESITKTKEKIYKYKIGNVILNKDMNVRKGWKIAGLIILGMLLQAGLSIISKYLEHSFLISSIS